LLYPGLILLGFKLSVSAESQYDHERNQTSPLWAGSFRFWCSTRLLIPVKRTTNEL